MTGFNDKHFDEGLYRKYRQEQEEAETRFTEAVWHLESEDIPTDHKSIVMLSTFTDDEYLDYIKTLFNNYVKNLGFVAKAERKRIAAIYNEIYSNTIESVQSIRDAFKKGLIISEAKDGAFIVEGEKMEQAARDKATISVDSKAMTEYYNLIMDVKKAMDKAADFEKKHGLSRFSDGESKLVYLNPYYPDFICELTLPKYFKDGDLSVDYFQKMVRQFFRKE